MIWSDDFNGGRHLQSFHRNFLVSFLLYRCAENKPLPRTAMRLQLPACVGTVSRPRHSYVIAPLEHGGGDNNSPDFEISPSLIKILNPKMSESLQTQTLRDRENRLQELTEFTQKCKKQLNDIFEALGWSLDYNQVTFNVSLITVSLLS